MEVQWCLRYFACQADCGVTRYPIFLTHKPLTERSLKENCDGFKRKAERDSKCVLTRQAPRMAPAVMIQANTLRQVQETKPKSLLGAQASVLHPPGGPIRS